MKKPWQIWADQLGKKMLDAANIALGALIFGQLVQRATILMEARSWRTRGLPPAGDDLPRCDIMESR